MADFKLTEVAKKAGVTTDEALTKLKEAGENIPDTAATVTVEQMRVLGVDPQQMIDRRKERLQQVIERRNRGSLGKEIVLNSPRAKEDTPVTASNRKISREELQKRKSELNKDVSKVDEVRQTTTRQKIEDVTEPTIDNEQLQLELPASNEPEVTADNVLIEQPLEIPVEPVNVAVRQAKHAEEKPVAAPVIIEPTPTPTLTPTLTPAVATSTPAVTKRPLGPAGYVPREQQARRPFTGERTNRPSGPAADRPYNSSRPGQDRAPRQYDDRNQGGGQARGGNRMAAGAGSSFTPKSDQFMRPDEERRNRDKKVVKEPELSAAAKEEIKKAKLKSDTKKTKDLNKTINEGINELNIENEVEAPATEAILTVPVQEGRPTARVDRRFKRKSSGQNTPPPTPKPTHINVGENITVADLAGLIAIKAAELVKKLFSMGIIATVNQAIDAETATLLAMDYGVEVTKKVITEEDLLPVYKEDASKLERRPPVVTVMGHVDHGKTSLLDAIRSTSVAEKEAGGITQHIGAYEVELSGRKITFLDTPGHEAFTSLRARGAQATDIVILVVAANDGVMPQTKEAIDHSKAAGVKIVVAVNKIDVPDANPDKVRQQLAEYGVISDEWGGEYQFQEISAKKHTGIEDLLERVLLEADVLDLKGDPSRPAEGIVVESQLDKQRGPVATVLVRNGTLHKGDTFIVGSQVGKVRSMHNYRHAVVKEASISMPVEVMGFSFVPEAGDKLIAIEDEKIAKNIADIRARHIQDARQMSTGAVSLSDFFDKVKQGEIKELNIIIKTDVQGSLEALKSSLQKLTNAEVKVNVVHDATGGITESDVVLASASKAIIIGFNVRPDVNAKALAEREGISIELYSIIYKVIDDIKLALEGMLTPDKRENITGHVDVRQVFSVPKLGKIAGCYVTDGKVTRSSFVRVVRDSVVVYDGKIGSLKRFTDDAKEVAQGYECGVSIDRYQDIKEGDVFEIYEIVEEKRTLDDVKPSE